LLLVVFQQLTERDQIKVIPRRSECAQILYREPKQSDSWGQSPSVFGVRRMFELFLQMHECPGRLDEALEITRILRRGAQPQMLEHVVRFVVTLFVPAAEEPAITGVLLYLVGHSARACAFQLGDETRNFLAFAHCQLNLTTPAMGKPARFLFSEGDRSRSAK